MSSARSPLATLLIGAALVLAPVVPAQAATPPPPAATAPAVASVPVAPVIELGPETTPKGVTVSGTVSKPGTSPTTPTPVDNVTLHVAIDGTKKADIVSGADGGFQADIAMPADGKNHTVVVTSDATPELLPGAATAQFNLPLPVKSVLTAQLDKPSVTSGFSIKVVGSLKTSTNQPAAAYEVLLDVGDKKGVAAARTEPDGTFVINAPAPKSDKETTVPVLVHFDGAEEMPAAQAALSLTVKPGSTEPSASTPTEPTTSTAAPVSEETDAPAPDSGPSITALWPIILTLGVGLAVLVTIAVMALRRKRETDLSEPAESLEDITHGDLGSED